MRPDSVVLAQSMDGLSDIHEVIKEEPEDLSEDAEDAEATGLKGKAKVIENATNMTDVDLSFEIEEIEVKISQVKSTVN